MRWPGHLRLDHEVEPCLGVTGLRRGSTAWDHFSGEDEVDVDEDLPRSAADALELAEARSVVDLLAEACDTTLQVDPIR